MKFIEDKLTFLAFALLTLIGIGFSACDADSEDPVTPKTLDQYKAELSEIVASEKVIVENCVIGYNKGDFKSDLNFQEYTAAYMAALLETETVLAGTDLTIPDVMAANEALTAPGKNFNDNIWISDRRPLQEVIVYCDTLRVHTPIGTETGAASQEAHDQFNTAISGAKSVRGRSSTIDRQVAEAVDELNSELVIFEDAIVK